MWCHECKFDFLKKRKKFRQNWKFAEKLRFCIFWLTTRTMKRENVLFEVGKLILARVNTKDRNESNFKRVKYFFINTNHNWFKLTEMSVHVVLLCKILHSGRKVQERKGDLSLAEQHLWKMGWARDFFKRYYSEMIRGNTPVSFCTFQ